MFLIVIDAYSKWMVSYTHTYSLPVVVSDHGTCFTSAEFKTFRNKNGIQHLMSAQYHPASNGLAERAVCTIQAGTKKDVQRKH